MSLPQTYKGVYSSAIPGGKHQIVELPLPKPGKNQVLVKIEYAPINPTDLISIKNDFYFPGSKPSQVGSEGSGTIVAVGEDLEVPFKVGDRVHVMWNSWAQYGLYTTNDVFKIQGNLSFEEAASHFANPATVHYMGDLVKRGGHKAAIHTAGSSALGRMLVRYFKHLGIRLINIVRREEYVEELKKEGADYVLNSKSADFEQKLKEIAEKENATIAFEAIAGDFTGTVLKAMPEGSTLYVYGLLSSTDVKIGVRELLQQKTVKGLKVMDYFKELHQKNQFRNAFEEFHGLLSTVLATKIQKVFKLDDLDKAIDYYNENSSNGKILIKFN